MAPLVRAAIQFPDKKGPAARLLNSLNMGNPEAISYRPESLPRI
jgi:hypothetical protein